MSFDFCATSDRVLSTQLVLIQPKSTVKMRKYITQLFLVMYKQATAFCYGDTFLIHRNDLKIRERNRLRNK